MRTDLVLLLGRITVVVQLLPNGLRKIAGFELTAAMMGGAPPQMIDGRIFPAQEPLFYFPIPEFFLACSITFDLLFTLCVIFGFKTRATAGFLAFYVTLAATIYHGAIASMADFLMLMRVLPFAGALMLIAVCGPGRWSIDEMLDRRRTPGLSTN